MVILGALVNGVAVVVGGVAGMVFRSRISQRLGDFLMQGLALCVALSAVQGMMQGQNVTVSVLSMVIGGAIGYALNIDGAIRRFGDAVQARLNRSLGAGTALGSFSEGFVSSTLFICIGAMAILGSLQSGLALDHSTLFSKALIDMVVIMIIATTLGVGVPFSGLAVFAYESVLSLGASVAAPNLSDAVIAEMVCTGSLLLLAIALNMLKLTDIKTANFLPAAFLPIVLCLVL